MTELTTDQRELLTSIVCGTEHNLKGLTRVNASRALHKAGLITPEGEPTEKGKGLVTTWQSFSTPKGKPSEKPTQARTATKAKSAILPSENPKAAPAAATKPSKVRVQSEPSKAPSKPKEPDVYEPSEPFQRIMDQEQKTIGYLVTRDGLSHALDTAGRLVNRGISHTTAEKRYRQLLKG